MRKGWSSRRVFLLTFALCGLLLCAAPVFSQDTIEALKEKIIDLQNEGDLGFRQFVLCSDIVSYGQYTPHSSNKVKIGSSIHFYYEPNNLYTKRSGGLYTIHFTQDLELQTPGGNVLLDAPDLLEFTYESASPVLDVYAKNTLNLQGLGPGEYVLFATMHDKLGSKNVTTEFIFEIVE